MSGRSARPPRGFDRPGVVVAIVAAVGLVALLALVVLPGDDDHDEPADVLEVSMVEMAFVPDDLRAHPGQVVSATNDGTVAHSLLVVGLGKGLEAAPGVTREFTLPDDVVGTFQVICDLPGHREAGMVATLTISEAAVGTDPDTGG